MNIPLLIQTIRHLRPTQVTYQLKQRLWHTKLREEVPPAMSRIALMQTQPIAKPRCYVGEGRFTFLNITANFSDWNMEDHGPLWAYNLNYMDWLEQEDITKEDCLKWIDKFIDDLPANRNGQAPYPTALRIMNWAKFFSKHPECLNQRHCESMYSQAIFLRRRLEYHLLGNHLLEDAYALFIASIFFNDSRLFNKAKRLLAGQLEEQILPDGAHYEQSPMYHCIMLDRLLDCINFSTRNILFKGQEAYTDMLKEKATKMLGHLQSIIYSDGTIPLFNDAARGIAPPPKKLFDYARRLRLDWQAIPLGECGYRKFDANGLEIIVDIGNIAASYQPGHSHADTFSYELRIKGCPVIVDTGISTYNKDSRRQHERSSAAHNTVSVAGKDSSTVWGGFRIGKRAKVTVEKDRPRNILVYHNGFGPRCIHQRHFVFNDHDIIIEDNIKGKVADAVSYLHFSPQTDVSIVSEADGLIKAGNVVIEAEGFSGIKIITDFVSSEYNKLQPCQVLEFSFQRQLKYSIKAT